MANAPVAGGSTGTTRVADAGLPARTPGWTLPQAYFNDAEIYRRDLERVWKTGWLFAGHTCEIPPPAIISWWNLIRSR